MEILTIVLSSLLSLAASGGAIADSVAASRLRSQVVRIEQQAVRIDNTPSYQVAQGKLQKVRIATRGIIVKPNFRIEALELETDPIDLNLGQLNFDSIEQLQTSLDQPFKGALRLVLTTADLNWALQSPEILSRIQQILNRQIVGKAGSTNISYQLQELKLQLLPGDRLKIKLRLNRPRSLFETTRSDSSQTKELLMNLELGIKVLNGRTVQIVEPEGTVNGKPMSSRLLNGFAVGISDRLNLDFLTSDGIFARILQLDIDEDKLELVSFLKVETKTSQLSSEEIKVVP